MYSVVLMFAMSGADLQVDRVPRRFQVSAGCNGASAVALAQPVAAGCTGSYATAFAVTRGVGCSGGAVSLAYPVRRTPIRNLFGRKFVVQNSTETTQYFAPTAVYYSTPVPAKKTPTTPPAVGFHVQQSAPVAVRSVRPLIVQQRPVFFTQRNCPNGNCPR